MIKKILLPIFLSTLILVGILTSRNVLADIGSDISGGTAGGSGGTVGAAADGYSLKIGPMIKVSLVKVSGDSLEEFDYHYFVYERYLYLLNNKNNNVDGAYRVCGKITNGKYSSECVNTKEKLTKTDDAWFMDDINWGLNINSTKIEKYVANEKKFENLVNKLNIKSLIGGKNFDFDTLTYEDVNVLGNYRMIIEPIYMMDVDYNGVASNKVKFATAKAWGTIVKNSGIGWDKFALGVNITQLVPNVYASNTHGNINKSGPINPNNISNSSWKNYYNALADINTGYGYGVFYVHGQGGCDPETSCCYDANGNYHKEYFDTTKNYKKENGVLKACVPIVVKECPKEEGIEKLNLNCQTGTGTTYYQKRIEIIEKTEKLSTTIQDYKKYDLVNSGQCGNEVERTIKGSIYVTQEVKSTIKIDNQNLYSGGGFSISAIYNGRAFYETCGFITYTIKDYYWDNQSKKCNAIEKTYYVDENSDTLEWKEFTKLAQEQLEEPKHGATMKSYDSNKVGTEKVTIGSWNSKYINDTNGNAINWAPGEEISYELSFSLNKACINRQTSKVRYTTDTKCDEETELDGGYQYYIPLKQPTGNFPIFVNIRDLNVLKDQTWSLDYQCGVECTQKLYKEDLSYKFIYRPISFASPFPNRLPLNNWVKLYEDKDEFAKAMSRDNLEYKITLTPKMIASIKNYNKKEKYTSLKGISKDGKSSYLSDLIGTDRTNTFNKLGECTNNCWITESINGVNK